MYNFNQKTIAKHLPGKDSPALTADITYPELSEIPGKAGKRLSRFYRRAVSQYTLRCEKDLLPEAAEHVNRAVEEGRPYQPWNAVMKITAEYEEDGRHIKIRREIEETAPRGGVTRLVFYDVWDANSGLPAGPNTERSPSL